MKTLNLKPYTFYLLLSLLLTMGMKCKKDETGIEALPPATQEGKNTFGCLVNGEAFTPKGSNFGGPILSSYYQYLNTSTAQGYFFNVLAKKRSSNNVSENISLDIISKDKIIKGKIYYLKSIGPENLAEAGYLFSNVSTSNSFKTKTNVFTGQLTIIQLDEAKQIVSGTFWFDAVNDKGEKVEVREGRFDVKYVQ
jgi:hypothetical protein